MDAVSPAASRLSGSVAPKLSLDASETLWAGEACLLVGGRPAAEILGTIALEKAAAVMFQVMAKGAERLAGVVGESWETIHATWTEEVPHVVAMDEFVAGDVVRDTQRLLSKPKMSAAVVPHEVGRSEVSPAALALVSIGEPKPVSLQNGSDLGQAAR